MKQIIIAVLIAATGAARVWAGAQQLILPKATADRFNVMEYVNPPANHGDAHVCLWEDDKEAAFVFVIDGAWAGDHKYWVYITDSLDITVNFFVISHTIGTGNWSNWDSVRVLARMGNAVQSHTAYHLNGTASYYTEYKGSKDSIESAMPGNICYTMGHAGGAIPGDPDSCALYYNGFRQSIDGSLPSKAARTNWAGTGSASTWNTERIETLLDPSVLIFGKSYRYGLNMHHMHNVGSAKAAITANLAQLKSYGDRLWIPRYQDVSRYGQERDTHTLTVTSVTDHAIGFTLTDEMHDTVFCYPLTVKVRVNDSWDSVSATQGGETVPAVLTVKDGKKYVLVKAVPDAGDVLVSDGSGAVSVITPRRSVVRAGAAGCQLYDVAGRSTGQHRGSGVYLVREGNVLKKVLVTE